MRIREHHCISPQKPIATGGVHNGFDDGLPNVWLPDVLRITERSVSVVLIFRADDKSDDGFVGARANVPSRTDDQSLSMRHSREVQLARQSYLCSVCVQQDSPRGRGATT